MVDKTFLWRCILLNAAFIVGPRNGSSDRRKLYPEVEQESLTCLRRPEPVMRILKRTLTIPCYIGLIHCVSSQQVAYAVKHSIEIFGVTCKVIGISHNYHLVQNEGV